MVIQAKNIARRLDLQSIYLHASSSAFLNEFDPLIGNQQLSGQFRIDTLRVDKKSITENTATHQFLRYFIQAGMRYIKGIPSDDEMKNEEWVKSNLASEITAIFCVEYLIKAEEELSNDEIKEFGRVNAPYHVWPYWREYCQNTCVRMSLPATMVPMLIIDTVPKQTDPVMVENQ